MRKRKSEIEVMSAPCLAIPTREAPHCPSRPTSDFRPIQKCVEHNVAPVEFI